MKKFKAKVWERIRIWELRDVWFEAEDLETAKELIDQMEASFDEYGDVEETIYDDEDDNIYYELQDGAEIEEIE